MKERTIEQYLRGQVKDIGGLCYKFVSPGSAGVPDRIVIYRGVTAFVEVKQEKGKVSALQNARLTEIVQNGGIALLVYNKEDVDNFIKVLKEGGRW